MTAAVHRIEHPRPAELLDPHELTEGRLVDGFENCTLDPALFDHESHVRVAWAYLQELTLSQAIERFSVGLKRFAAAAGSPKKYHETMSWFYVIKISERYESGAKADWPAFRAANPDLFAHKGGLLFDYYSKDLLTSKLARCHFVLPDRAPACRTPAGNE